MKTCPRCGRQYNDFPARSRRADVDICSECGREEGIIDAKERGVDIDIPDHVLERERRWLVKVNPELSPKK